MGGDKIVLLDGAGANGGGAATNGLLSMIPGMFANLIGGNKMDPNLVAALMNGRNNQDGFGGANGWWLWIIVLFWLWGGRGFGNGFGNGGDCCANGLPAQLNNDYGRELLMQAIQGNRSAIDQIASALNCSTTQLQNAICNVQGAIDKVAGQVGMTSQAVINAVQQQGCEIGNQISSCCCNLSSLINHILNKYGHTEMGMYKIQLYIENILGSIQNKKPVDVGEVSDGYHTFNELYRYRMLYNAAFFNLLARSGQVEVCKSRRHSDGEKCFGSDDWFIVMAILPTGQVSNHYESKYWDLFDVPERETAFEYDGHTPNEASDRLEKYLKLPRHGMTFEQALERLKLGRKIKRIDWGKKYICMFDVNILMIDTGQKVASNWNPTEHDIMSNDWEIAG